MSWDRVAEVVARACPSLRAKGIALGDLFVDVNDRTHAVTVRVRCHLSEMFPIWRALETSTDGLYVISVERMPSVHR